MESWKEAAIQSRISLPRLTDFDWTLQLMKSSNEVLWCSFISQNFLTHTYIHTYMHTWIQFNIWRILNLSKTSRSRLDRTYSILVIVPIRDVGPQLLHNQLWFLTYIPYTNTLLMGITPQSHCNCIHIHYHWHRSPAWVCRASWCRWP